MCRNDVRRYFMTFGGYPPKDPNGHIRPMGDDKEPFRLAIDPRKQDYVSGSLFEQEQRVRVQMQILESRAWDEPDNAELFRKLARCRFKLWHLNLDAGCIALAREAYEKALSIKENTVVGALWAEAAMVRVVAIRAFAAAT